MIQRKSDAERDHYQKLERDIYAEADRLVKQPPRLKALANFVDWANRRPEHRQLLLEQGCQRALEEAEQHAALFGEAEDETDAAEV